MAVRRRGNHAEQPAVPLSGDSDLSHAFT